MSNPSSSRIRFFTICAANYLANAIVLGRSIAAAHPGSRLVVFLLDPLPQGCAGLDDIDVVAVESTMSVADWHHYRCFYSILELATAVKPLCFLHLFDGGCDAVVYLDADIVVFAPLERVLEALRQGAEIVLTPHLLTPLPADGKLPDDLSIMRAGIYNLGFAAFANTERCRAFLAWWSRHLRTLGLNDVGAGLFTDQKWMDFAPAFSGATCILRDPGYNVAYWNLHERAPVQADGRWRVDCGDGSQGALAFYHFSGYSPSSQALSKHETRFGARPPADTRRLLDDYGVRLAAAGHAVHAQRPFAEPRFANGIAWDAACRILYRNLLKADPAHGDPLQGDDFLAFAADEAFGDHVPRYVRAVLALRPDVARAYDDGRNRKGLDRWLARDGVRQLGLDPRLLKQLRAEGDVHERDAGVDDAVPGVDYIGYFRSHLGVGEAARNAVTAIRAAGLDVTTHDISHMAGSPTGAYGLDRRGRHARHEITILGVNADETPRVLDSLPASVRSTRLIGSWAWETPDFPDAWCDRFGLVDEVWVASRFVAEAVRAKATVPVLVVPYAVSVPRVEPDKAWLAQLCPGILAGEFTFLCFLDIGSVAYRKNPRGAIDAFTRAFAPHETVRLIVKVLNGERDPALLRALRELARNHRVSILDTALESFDRFRLLASTDAFVSLHRSEGFGLAIAEAMALARPVVVTGWSGNVDFTHDGNAALVRFRLVRSDVAHGPYAAGTQWAEADLHDAARQMRRVRDDREWRDAIATAAARTVATQLSAAAVGAIIRARLERLAATVHRGERRAASASHVRASERVPAASALVTVSRDMFRRPLHYVERAPRLPVMLAREGPRRLLNRLAFKAREHRDVTRRRSSLRGMFLRFWSIFTRG